LKKPQKKDKDARKSQQKNSANNSINANQPAKTQNKNTQLGEVFQKIDYAIDYKNKSGEYRMDVEEPKEKAEGKNYQIT